MLDMDLLKEIGADTEEGLAFCADDPEFYEEMICEYIDEYETRVSEMQGSFEKQDLGMYGISSHSLKNTSRMIGLTELASEAAALEKAAKASDLETVAAGHPDLIINYGKAVEGLKKAAGIS